ARQLSEFRGIMAGDPTHIDSHQHVHREEPVRAVAVRLARELGVPLRHFEPGIRYCGAFYGQTGEGAPLPENISVEALLGIIRALPSGVTELACHPGDASGLDTMYRTERSIELQSLCARRVREAIDLNAVTLSSFADRLRVG